MAPIREYQCNDCGHEQEHLVPQWDEFKDDLRCVHCDSPKMTQLFSMIGSYAIKGSNSASTRPKAVAGRKKADSTKAGK